MALTKVNTRMMEGRTATTIAALRALDPDDAADVIEVQGHTTAGDGGGGSFRYVSGSSATDDNGITIAPTAGSGRWIRQLNGAPVSVAMYGAAEGLSAATNTTAFQAALDYAATQQAVYLSGKSDRVTDRVIIPAGTFALTPGGTVVAEGVSLRGAGMSLTELTGSGASGAIIKVGGASVEYSGINISDMTISGDGTALTAYDATAGLIGLDVEKLYRLGVLQQVRVRRCDTNIKITGFAIRLIDCYSISANIHCLHVLDGTASEIVGGRYEYSSTGSVVNIEDNAGAEPVGITVRGAAIQNGERQGLIVDTFQNVTVQGCFFEGNNNTVTGGYNDAEFTNSSSGGTVSLLNNSFTNSGSHADTSNSAIYTSNIKHITGIGNWVRDTSTADYDSAVEVAGTTENLIWLGNFVQLDAAEGTDAPINITGSVAHLLTTTDDDGLDLGSLNILDGNAVFTRTSGSANIKVLATGSGQDASFFLQGEDECKILMGTAANPDWARILIDVDANTLNHYVNDAVYMAVTSSGQTFSGLTTVGTLLAKVYRNSVTITSSNIAETDDDTSSFISCASGNRQRTLPAAPANGTVQRIKKTDGGSNVISVISSSGDVIDGGADPTTLQSTTAYAAIELEYTAGIWHIMSTYGTWA